MRRFICIIIMLPLFYGCSAQLSAPSLSAAAQQFWQSLALTWERFISPDEAAKREANQNVETVTQLIEQLRNALANDQLDQAMAILRQLLPLKTALPIDFQQEVARLEAMLADQPPPLPQEM
ncbi:hypothetical protein CKO09_07910 [Chromatium weissei]|nr:hypothetical protein [Chromatium weissei]